jgi:hypothetical protein
MQPYPQWRTTAELVEETVGEHVGRVHIRLIDSARLLCDTRTTVRRLTALPPERDDLTVDQMHRRCLIMVPY